MAEKLMEPVSLSDQCFNNSVLSISNLCVYESEISIDESLIIQFVRNCLLTINPTFYSIMVADEHTGKAHWKRVEVDLDNHVKIPKFPSGMPREFYEKCFDEYLGEIGLEELPQSQPLWTVHIVKYPTRNAEGAIIFNLHQSLGDGYSLMSIIFSYFRKADNPSLPVTFPSINMRSSLEDSYSVKSMFKILNWAVSSVSDFSRSVLKSSFLEDDKSPIRSGKSGVESRPICVSTVKFSLDHIKEIKAKLGVTVNDVITTIIFMGSRIYMQEMDKTSANASSTALIILNTRMLRNYKSMEDMVNPKKSDDDGGNSNDGATWGNHLAELCVTIPVLTSDDFANPLGILKNTHESIKNKRHSSAIYLTDYLQSLINKYAGPKATSQFLYNTFKNSSMVITNMIGPVEKMSLASHPIKDFYFASAGCPTNLLVSVVSYMGELRIGLVAEKDFIDNPKLKSCMERAFEMTLKAAREN